ncbi:MAG: transglycosylase SLT domain-containing protein [Bacteriovoracaceae bacterium]|nr:transglycosylase SLT domain-containing protein [Bacteriovoracaceae bacterium]
MTNKKQHPWRKCPIGEHWVREHERKIGVSEKNLDGVTIVEAHCRKNPSHHEIFVADELHEIAKKYFKNVKTMPKADKLGYPHGNDFDELIGGWTQFWNDIFNPKEPLDPNLIKVLIASESSFDVNISANSTIGKARGLIQVTEQTRKILTDQDGELKDFLITLSKKEFYDPNLNLAAGIRWLFHKQYLASHRLKREATWMEAIAEYKGILSQLGKVKRSDEIMQKLKERYKRLSTK